MKQYVLKPCPFCGKPAELRIARSDGRLRPAGSRRIFTDTVVIIHTATALCPIASMEPIGGYEYNSKREAAEWWNRRYNNGNKT